MTTDFCHPINNIGLRKKRDQTRGQNFCFKDEGRGFIVGTPCTTSKTQFSLLLSVQNEGIGGTVARFGSSCGCSRLCGRVSGSQRLLRRRRSMRPILRVQKQSSKTVKTNRLIPFLKNRFYLFTDRRQNLPGWPCL